MKKYLLFLLFLCITIMNYTNISAKTINYNYMTKEIFERDFVNNNLCVTKKKRSSNFDTISYFQNLYEHSPENSHGSCGYVSLIQYLCYYDTFYNDNIIPENYDCNEWSSSTFSEATSISPGVLRMPYPNVDFYDYVQETKEYDFQMYLIDVVNQYKNTDSSDYSYGIGMWDYFIILDELFNSYVPYNYISVNDLSGEPTDDFVIDYFDDYVKSNLELGIPMILHICKYQEDGTYKDYHSVVAYYYDDDGIHANFGWGESSTDVVIPSTYQITSAGKIDLTDVEEVHSDNYMVKSKYYCGCGYVKHEHSYMDHYCTECDKYSEIHNYHAPYAWNDYSTHTATCGCGSTQKQGHIISSSSVGTSSSYCLICGGLAKIGFVEISSINNLSNDDWYITSNGIIVINDELLLTIDDLDLFYLNIVKELIDNEKVF